MSRASGEELVRQWEALSNSSKREAELLISRTIKLMDGSDQDRDRMDELLIAIMSSMNKYIRSAVYSSEVKNRLDGIPGVATVPDLTINGKTATARIKEYLNDLRLNVKGFLEENPGKRDLLYLGIGVMGTPEFMAQVRGLHLTQVRSGSRSAGTSASFLANIERNIFGNIFYAGRLAENQIWAQANASGIEVITQKDSLVCAQCAAMEGMYPPDYIFVGNHPRCRCIGVPVFGPFRVDQIPSRSYEFMSVQENRNKYRSLKIITLNEKYYKEL